LRGAVLFTASRKAKADAARNPGVTCDGCQWRDASDGCYSQLELNIGMRQLATNDCFRETAMATTRRTILLSLVLPLAATFPARAAAPLKMLDPDKDGTVDMAEAKAAASKLFDRLDRDKDGTLDLKELRGRVSKAEFAAADPDKDGTIDKNEYLAIVEARFRAADPDNDGTLDAKELATSAGKALLKLLV
jgi:hypothetical protein